MPGDPIDRRGFLRAGALGAAALAVGSAVAGCEDAEARASHGVPATTDAPATPAQWAAYVASISGHVVRPNQRAFGIDKLLYNPRFDSLRPLAIAYCASPQDVARSIDFARAHAYPLAVRCGGHSYGGYSSGEGRLVVDVTPMSGVAPTSKPGSWRVGAGARLIDVYNTLGSHGRLIPGGSCPTVGIAGLTLGGGVGVFARRYGLAADNLAAVTLVTADAEVRRCTPEHDEALFWACRGGGGGNFGVATSFEFTTHAVPPITLFTYDFSWSAARDVLGEWQHWTQTVNEAVWSNCQLLSGGGATSVHIAGVACAHSSQAAAWLAPLLARLPAPTYSFLGDETYQNEMMVESGCSGLTVAACHLDTTFRHGVLSRQAFAASSNYVAAPMRDARLAEAVGAVDQLASTLPELGGGLVFDALGGAVNAVASTDTAFVHRTYLASIQSSFNWTASTRASEVAAGPAWLEHVRSTVYDSSTGAYQNYADPTLPDFATAYYGRNLPRLSGIKRVYDPDRVFRFAQSVPS